MAFDPTKRQQITAKAKLLLVEGLPEGGTFYSAHFELQEAVEGFGQTIKVLANSKAWSEDDFKDRSEVKTLVFDFAPNKDPKKSNANYLVEWDGKRNEYDGGPKKGKGEYKPKSQEEIHSAAASGIIKTCIEAEGPDFKKSSFDVRCTNAFEQYWAQMDKARTREGLNLPAAPPATADSAEQK